MRYPSFSPINMPLPVNSVTIQTATTGTDSATEQYGTTGSNGDIFVNDAVSWSANNTLTLNAFRNINVNAAITSSGAGGKVPVARRKPIPVATLSLGFG